MIGVLSSFFSFIFINYLQKLVLGLYHCLLVKLVGLCGWVLHLSPSCQHCILFLSLTHCEISHCACVNMRDAGGRHPAYDMVTMQGTHQHSWWACDMLWYTHAVQESSHHQPFKIQGRCMATGLLLIEPLKQPAEAGETGQAFSLTTSCVVTSLSATAWHQRTSRKSLKDSDLLQNPMSTFQIPFPSFGYGTVFLHTTLIWITKGPTELQLVVFCCVVACKFMIVWGS